MRTGTAQSPLHWGRAPAWLFTKMAGLARELTLVMVSEFGPHEVLRRLSDPMWFQAFGCVLGFDWHSSGLTTTVCGALKEGLRGVEGDSGFFVAGGKGRTSRRTPAEIESASDRLTVNPAALVYASRMSAKVDSAAVQDGYQLYHHCFLFTFDGSWAVVQQGMNTDNRLARRYHWLSDDLDSFVLEPHRGVCCDKRSPTLNLTAAGSTAARRVSATLVRDNPAETLRELERTVRIGRSCHKKAASDSMAGEQMILPITGVESSEAPPHLEMPCHHPVTLADIDPARLGRIILSAHESQPADFEALLGLRGVGPATVRSLCLIGELLYGAAPSFEDPARYSFAHGGKDGYPYPVDRENYQSSIDFLKGAVAQASIGRSDRLEALKRLACLESTAGT